MANNNNNNIPNVPALRFPEFSGEWEKCSIQDYGEVVTGNTPPTSHAEYYENGSYLWASPADLGINKNITETKNKLSLSGFKKTRSIPKGSVLVTCIGSTIGKMGMATETMSSNQQINSIVVNDKSNSDFVYYAICRAFPRYLSEVGVQAVPILSKSNFEKLPNYTTCRDEQDKIGYFLNLLDERIATQSKIIEEQETLLKSLADKLFNTLDIVTKLHLGDISELYQPKTIPLSNLSSKGYPVYGANGIIGSYKNFNHITEQICIACRGSSCGSVNYTVPKAWITGNAMVVNTDNYSNIIDKRYLYYYLRCINYSSLISGSGQPQIVRAPLANLLIPVPTLEKQKHVVLILDTVAKILGTNKTILLHYQNQKAYLLSHMFI